MSAESVSDGERLRRWRLILGPAAVADAEHGATAAPPPQSVPSPSRDVQADDGRGDTGGGDGAGSSDGASDDPGDGPGAGTGDGASDVHGAGTGDDIGARRSDGGPGGAGRGEGSGGVELGADDQRIDAALAPLYDSDGGLGGGRSRAGGPLRAGATGRGRAAGRAGRRGGLGGSQPSIARWLGDVRRYFPTPVVQMLQRDAVERLDLRQLLLEPELLANTEPDVSLVTMLVELNRLLPDETRATARLVIARVLDELRAALGDDTRRAVRGALARSARTSRPRPADIDWQRTIAANLQHWMPEYRTVVPERLVGHGRRQPSLARDVIIAVDQSGSMADSVVFASLFAGVLAQLPALRTRFVAFDTSITDLTPLLDDPVEVLFGVQLGGGTDIAGALTYCQRLVTAPYQSVVFVVSDLFEGGDRELMRRRVYEMARAGVTVVVLLALSDEGTPAHDRTEAAALAQLGAHVASCTPREFPDLLRAVLA